MLIPLRHENMHGRRWPVITLGLIALNTLIFLGTHARMEREGPELGQVKIHILILAAMHPQIEIAEPARQMVETIRTKDPAIWKQLQSQYRPLEDGWDAKIRLEEDPAVLQQEMNSLTKQYSDLEASTILGKYAFVPAHPTAISYLTANFLHAGWLHLIGNMWFLWLAGAILEDTWGRLIYPAFYLIAGLLALQVHAMFNPESLIPTIGASGAIAGLMGAFLVRYPKIKIEMGWLLFFRVYRFKAAAYWLLPVWLLMEVFYGSLAGQSSGIAHWAHVGGFAFGALIAVAVRKSGLEQIAEKGIQENISWVSHPLLVEASEQLERGELDAAASNLHKVLQEKPDSMDACRMLQQVYWRKQDTDSYRKTLEKLMDMEIKANEVERAWQTYQDFKNSGESKLSPTLWLDLCRQLETQPDVERMVCEYKDLAQAYPGERTGLLAQIAAGRIYLKRLTRPEEALRCYEAAKASLVPHLDWEATIDRGIADARKCLRPQNLPV